MRLLDENLNALQARLQTSRFGRTAKWLDVVDSTNPLALDWAKRGAPTGSIVAAEFQRKGRGRFDRSWLAEPGENLTFSLILDASELSEKLELLPMALAVAVAQTLDEVVPTHRPQIKWPNDVLLAGRKVCGMLIESAIASVPSSRSGQVVAGIGINVNQSRFPPELAETATSLFQVLGGPCDRVQLLADLLLELELAFDLLIGGDGARLLQRYESLLFGRDRPVNFRRVESGREEEGMLLGVDDSGGLRVKTAGTIEILRAGEVSFRQPKPAG